jgi:hypothetical protein
MKIINKFPSPHNYPSTGNLITLDKNLTKIPIFGHWGSKNKPFPRQISEFNTTDIAIIIQDLHHQGGNGCKILTSNGTIGWINIHMISYA